MALSKIIIALQMFPSGQWDVQVPGQKLRLWAIIHKATVTWCVLAECSLFPSQNFLGVCFIRNSVNLSPLANCAWVMWMTHLCLHATWRREGKRRWFISATHNNSHMPKCTTLKYITQHFGETCEISASSLWYITSFLTSSSNQKCNGLCLVFHHACVFLCPYNGRSKVDSLLLEDGAPP